MSDTTSLKAYTTASSNLSIAETTTASTISSRLRRKEAFHVSSFAFSVVCKLLAVYNSPPAPKMRSTSTSTTNNNSSRPSSSATATTTTTTSASQSIHSARSSSTANHHTQQQRGQKRVPHPPPLLPISVYGDISGPHLCKVVLVLKELGLAYGLKVLDLASLRDDPNPPSAMNRAVPAIEDPNTGVMLWESGAIVEYLVETYDSKNKLRYTSFPERWHQKQWAWHQFGSGHESLLNGSCNEAFISVHEYYRSTIRETLSTIEGHLSATGNLYLVGDRCTYADLMYIASREVVTSLLMESFVEDIEVEWKREWPRAYDWYQRLMLRDCVKEAFGDRRRIMDERGWVF
ncbi:Glutathione S-transferase [Sphaerulina musiva]